VIDDAEFGLSARTSSRNDWSRTPSGASMLRQRSVLSSTSPPMSFQPSPAPNPAPAAGISSNGSRSAGSRFAHMTICRRVPSACESGSTKGVITRHRRPRTSPAAANQPSLP
jgi:hypothetical protein